MIADAESFLTTWAAAADRLGWTTLDLFGVHPVAPASRFDVMGLIPMLRGDTVSALTEQFAAIQCVSGAGQSFRRPNNSGAVLLAGELK
jgi:hypothetical protein